MKLLYAAPLCGLLIFANYISIRAQGQKNPLARALRQLIIVVIVTVVTGILAVLSLTENMALFAQCLHGMAAYISSAVYGAVYGRCLE